MHLSINPIRQDEHGCAVTCLRMVLGHFGCDATGAELAAAMLMGEHRGATGTALTELALCAHRLGFEARCFAYNLQLTDPSAVLSRGQLLRRLEASSRSIHQEVDALVLRTTVRCLRDGVRYTVEKPSRGVVRAHAGRVPLIVAVNHCALRGTQGDPWAGHDLVITGLEGDRCSFIDPNNAYEETTDLEDLLFAMMAKKLITQSAYMVTFQAGPNSHAAGVEDLIHAIPHQPVPGSLATER